MPSDQQTMTNQSGIGTPQQRKVGEVSGTAIVTNPWHAVFHGRPVRVLAIGNQEGKSPVYLIQDENHSSHWEPISDVRIIDTAVQPLNPDVFDQAVNWRTPGQGQSPR